VEAIEDLVRSVGGAKDGGGQRSRHRRSLAAALGEAGLGDTPVVVREEPCSIAPQTTLKVSRGPDRGIVAVAAAQQNIIPHCDEMCGAFEEVASPSERSAAVPGEFVVPPWLRMKRRARLRSWLVNATAWVATLMFTGGVLTGGAYLLASHSGPALKASPVLVR